MILSTALDYPFVYTAPSPLFADSFSSSTRQQAYTETAAQRRARVEFLATQTEKREGDRRVENWVKSQVSTTALLLAAAYAQAPSASKTKSSSSSFTKGHRRRRPFASSNRKSRSQDDIYDQLHLSPSLHDSYQSHYTGHLSTISELEEDADLEPYIFYSTPKTSPPTPISIPASVTLVAPKPSYPSSFNLSFSPETPSPPSSPSSTYTTSTVTPSSRYHHRRGSSSSLSSLGSIPEEE